jgi:glycosyltransferase involved in cell wall biosynthesis
MQENSIVSVICLCYNHSKFVIECLESIKNQTYKNIQVIVIDDFSTDNSVEIISDYLKDFHKIQFIKNEKNLGNTKSFNIGLQFAKGEFIIDLATDDVLLPNCVESQLEKFSKSNFSNLGIVYGNAENILENGQHDSYFFEIDANKKIIEPRPIGDIYAAIIAGSNSYCSASAMIKKSVYDDLNGYNEKLAYEDLDFWIRTSRKYNIDYLDEILMQKRIVKNSLGNQFFKKNHKINDSTYLILKNTLALNKNKKEDLALLKRVHYEIYNCYKNKIYGLLIKNLGLKTRLFLRINFS